MTDQVRTLQELREYTGEKCSKDDCEEEATYIVRFPPTKTGTIVCNEHVPEMVMVAQMVAEDTGNTIHVQLTKIGSVFDA
jgi:hypothetical protein